MSKRITIDSNGSTQVYRTDAATIGELWNNREFREDFNISERAQPMVNNANVEMNTRINEGDTIGYFVGASSKSEKDNSSDS